MVRLYAFIQCRFLSSHSAPDAVRGTEDADTTVLYTSLADLSQLPSQLGVTR